MPRAVRTRARPRIVRRSDPRQRGWIRNGLLTRLAARGIQILRRPRKLAGAMFKKLFFCRLLGCLNRYIQLVQLKKTENSSRFSHWILTI